MLCVSSVSVEDHAKAIQLLRRASVAVADMKFEVAQDCLQAAQPIVDRLVKDRAEFLAGVR